MPGIIPSASLQTHARCRTSWGACSSSKCHVGGGWKCPPSLFVGHCVQNWSLCPEAKTELEKGQGRRGASVCHHALAAEVRVSLWPQIILSLPLWRPTRLSPPGTTDPRLLECLAVFCKQFHHVTSLQLLFLHIFPSLPKCLNAETLHVFCIFSISIVCACSTCLIKAC